MIRQTTLFTALVTARSGCGFSLAAIVTISAPMNENITTRIPAKIASVP
jgi:hypothetical protein